MRNKAAWGKWSILAFAFVLLSACGGGSKGVVPSSASPTPIYPISVSKTLTSNATQMGLKPWRNAGYTGNGVTVAVLDTGMPVPDITDRDILLSENLRYDVYTDDTIRKNSDTSIENANHGNDMSQVIGSSTFGAAPNVGILNGVIADTTGITNQTSMIKGVEWSLNHHADIINLSFNYGALNSYVGAGYVNVESELNAIKSQAIASNVAIVHSAGNDSASVSAKIGSQDWLKTGAKANILIVGATYDNQSLAYFSNYAGSDPDVQSRFVVAPAQSEVTDGYQKLYTVGTSGAAANVSGALAVMKERWQSLTGKDLEQIVLDTADRSFSGYSASVFGQGVVDLKSAFSPVGKTSIPISSTASVPLSAASVALPAGFTPVTVSSAFVDHYQRDFTLSFQTPVLPYDSGVDKLTRDFASGQEQPQQWVQPISSTLSAQFQSSGLSGYRSPDTKLLYLGLASNYRQQMGQMTMGQAGLQIHAAGMTASFNALIPRSNAQADWRTQMPKTEGGSVEFQYDGFSVKPYWLQTSGAAGFSGAKAQNLTGVLSQFEKNGWVAGFEYSEQRQPGVQLVQDYRIASRRYFAGYQSQWKGLEFGVMGYRQRDRADIGFYHPASVGDGSLYYVKDSLESERQLDGVSASLATKAFKLSVLSNNLDTVTFLGWRKHF